MVGGGQSPTKQELSTHPASPSGTKPTKGGIRQSLSTSQLSAYAGNTVVSGELNCECLVGIFLSSSIYYFMVIQFDDLIAFIQISRVVVELTYVYLYTVVTMLITMMTIINYHNHKLFSVCESLFCSLFAIFFRHFYLIQGSHDP